MTDERFDLIVLGAGPAGAAAAVKACALGLRTVVIDEALAGGGQVYRAPAEGLALARPGADQQSGEELRRRLAECGAMLVHNHRAWLAGPGFVVEAVGDGGARRFHGDCLVAATGAMERHLPVAGWTLPGVIGLAAATVLLKAHKVLPGRNVVVAGSGPLLFLVAAGIVAAGGRVAAVVDANPLSAWLSRLPEMAARPDLLARGIGWAFALRRAGVPVFHGHALRAIGGSTDVEGVLIGPIDRRWRPAEGPARTLAVDGVCLGFGLLPATDVTRLLGAAHSYRPGLGGWVPDLDENMETSVSGLFVAGDAGGVRGADAAPFSGELAAIGAARRLGRGVGEEKQQGTLLRSWRRAARFGAAMSSLAMPPPEAEALIPDEATVCRCECLSRAVLDRAIEAGSRTLADLKAATRCGMGPCGGKVCMEAAAMLVAAATGASREALGQPSARPPLRPVPLDAIAGSFDYDDLPIPAPAPL